MKKPGKIKTKKKKTSKIKKSELRKIADSLRNFKKPEPEEKQISSPSTNINVWQDQNKFEQDFSKNRIQRIAPVLNKIENPPKFQVREIDDLSRIPDRNFNPERDKSSRRREDSGNVYLDRGQGGNYFSSGETHTRSSVYSSRQNQNIEVPSPSLTLSRSSQTPRVLTNEPRGRELMIPHVPSPPRDMSIAVPERRRENTGLPFENTEPKYKEATFKGEPY
jgi:hypothetical protein